MYSSSNVITNHINVSGVSGYFTDNQLLQGNVDYLGAKHAVRLPVTVVPGLGRHLVFEGTPSAKGINMVITKRSYLDLGDFSVPLCNELAASLAPATATAAATASETTTGAPPATPTAATTTAALATTTAALPTASVWQHQLGLPKAQDLVLSSRLYIAAGENVPNESISKLISTRR